MNRGAQQHFDGVAGSYQSLRTTDDEPVLAIRDSMDDQPVVGLDAGAGNGRYTQRLLKVLPPGSALMAVDLNGAMLRTFLRDGVPRRARAVRGASEALPCADGSLGLVTSFNAVHHFHLDSFAAAATRALAPAGHLFVYSRTPDQNAASIWGRHFPGFADRETRLHSEAALLRSLGRLGPAQSRSFRFPRRATPSRLAEQVRGRHYSTFSMYDDDELEVALATFLSAIGDTDEVTWVDQNVLVHVPVT